MKLQSVPQLWSHTLHSIIAPCKTLSYSSDKFLVEFMASYQSFALLFVAVARM